MALTIRNVAPLDPLPTALSFPTERPTEITEKASLGGLGMHNYLFDGGRNIPVRPFTFVYRNIVASVSGNVIGLPNTSDFGTRPTGFLDGAEVWIERPDGNAQYPRLVQPVAKTTVVDWQANTVQQFEVSAGTTVFTSGPVSTTHRTYYQPGGQYWFGVASLNSAGDQSEWAFIGPVTIPASPARDDSVYDGSTYFNGGVALSSVASVSSPTGVVDTGIPAPTGLVLAGDNTNAPSVDFDALPGGVVGVRIARFDVDPVANPGNDAAQLADATGIQVGDQVTILRRFDGDSPLSERATYRSWALGAKREVLPFFRFSNDPETGTVTSTFVEVDGQPCLRIVMAPGARRNIRRVCWEGSGSAVPYYTVLAEGPTYRARMNGRKLSGDGTIRAKNTALAMDAAIVLPDTFGDVDVDFTGNATTTAGGPDGIVYELDGGTTGLEVEIRLVTIYNTEAAPYALSPAVRQRLVDFDHYSYRDHSFIKRNPDSLTPEQMTDLWGWSGNSLHKTLENQVGLTGVFWFQLPGWWLPEHAAQMMEYFHTPYDPGTDTPAAKPFAYKRFANGRAAPWTDDFDLEVEDSNERWNDLDGFWYQFGVGGLGREASAAAVVNAKMDAIKAIPDWSTLEPKFHLAVGGRFGSGWAETVSPLVEDAHWITYNIYGGDPWEDNPGGTGQFFAYTDEYAANGLLLDETKFRAGWESAVAWVSAANAGRPADKQIEIAAYEMNWTNAILPSSADDPNVVADQELGWKSMAIQTAVVQEFLLANAVGRYRTTNFFAPTHSGGANWEAWQTDAKGGATYAAFQALGLINREMYPGYIAEMKSPIMTGVSARDPSGVLLNGLPTICALAFWDAQGNPVGAYIGSRRIPGQGVDAGGGDGISAVRIKAPGGAASYNRWTMTGQYNAANNTVETANDFVIQQDTVAPVDGFLDLTIPPGKWVLLKAA